MVEERVKKIEKELEVHKEAIKERLAEGDEELNQMRDMIGSIQNDLHILRYDIRELLDIFRASKGFVRVMAAVGRTVRWLIPFFILVGLIIAAVKGHFK